MQGKLATWSALAACFIAIGCVPGITNTYRATVLDGSGHKSASRAVIEVDAGVTIDAYGECFPGSDLCRIVIHWYYPKASIVSFEHDAIAARGSGSPRWLYAADSSASRARSIHVEDKDVTGRILLIDLDDRLPKEVELALPRLKVDGVYHEIPIIRFAHSKGPALVPVIYNY